MCDVNNTISGSRLISITNDLKSGDISKSMGAKVPVEVKTEKRIKAHQRIGVDREIRFRRCVGVSVRNARKKAASLSST